MAKTAVTGADLTNLRTGSQYSDVALFVTPKTTIAVGTIDSVPDLSPYISLGISWTSGQSNVVVGQLFEIRDSSNNLVSYGVVRKTPTSSIFYCNTTPLGSAGYATTIERAIQAGDTLTVYNHRPLWSLYSRIGANGTFYKSWDIPYTDENEDPPPVANAGTWQAAQVSVGESATFTLPKEGSNTSFNFGSATTQTRLWTLPAGVSLVSGYATSDAVIEVTATAGTHLVSYTHTDSNSKAHTAYLWLFVSDGTTGASLSERYAVEIVDDTQDTRGRTMQFVITGENLEDILYPGAGFLFREWGYYNGTTLSEGVAIDSFVGYLGSDIDIQHDGNIGTATITVMSPYLYAATLPQPSQVVEEVANPSKWTEITSDLSNPRGFLYYAMKWHTPALLDMHDLDAPYTTPRRKNAQWQKGSLADAMAVSAEYLAGSVGSASDGTTVLRANPLYMDNADRNALATIITWQDRDLLSQVQYVKRQTQPLNESRTGAFAYNGSTVKAWLARKFWQQGVGSATMPNFTVTASDGLDRVLEVIGHFHAEQNRSILEITLPLLLNQDIIDPVYLLWCQYTLSSDYDPMGAGFTTQRGLIKSITRDWEYDDDHKEWYKTITYGFQPETFGQIGEEIPIKNYNAYSISIPSFYLPYNGDGAFGGSAIMLALTSGGELAITFNYQATNPEWGNITPFVNGETVNDFCIDYGSAYYANGNNTNYALGLYVVTTDSTTLNVWYFADILNSTEASIIASATMADSSNTSEARIEVSETAPDLVVVVWHDQTGVECIRSTNGGTSFSSKFNIGDAITDTINDNAAIGLDLDGELQAVTAPNSSNEYGLYLASTDSGSFSRLTNSVASTIPYSTVKIVYDDDDLYTALATAGNQLVTFDSGTDAVNVVVGSGAPSVPYCHFTLTGGSTLTQPALDASAGNPDDCGRWQQSTGTWYPPGGSSVGDPACFIRYVAAGTNVLNDVTFDYYVNSGISAHDIEISVLINTTGGNEAETITGLTYGSWTSISLASATSIPFPLTLDSTDTIRIAFQCDTAVTLSSTPSDIRIDNIETEFTSAIQGAGGGQALYFVQDFDGTDAWSDRSPSSGEAPTRPHDLGIDLVDPTVLNTYVSATNKWYSSSDAGSNWSTEATSSDKQTFYTSGGSILGAGTGEIELALNGTTFESKLGNLANVVSSIGTIKRVFAL